ncbi:hypothetical protein F8M41_017503 [Gigaspora margarita]|uniref:Uncharacterized protein n=1 Tax=Gigaspora margarita TaxID=4874 RepID=A0A8H4AN44_GIGMA|nr:hypothetical protein F8M41_017503 [Gigaspora margarita]
MISKIFTGDMPELMENILNNLNNEIYSLYSGATLHKLDLNIFESLVIEPEIFDSLGENTQFFSHLQSLCLSALPNHEFSVGITTELLIILSDKAAKINTLEIILNAADPELFQALLCVIESQEKLKKFLICSLISIEEFYGIISALESQKNTLQEFIISVPGSCSEEFEVLKNCKNLEILRISYCEDAELLKKLNYKISTLQIIGGSIDASTMVQILEESGTLLQRIFIKEITSGSESIEIWEKSLLEAFMSFCPNITYLDISIIGFSTQLLKLIGNLQKLQFLTLRCDVEDMPKEELKKRVIQFAEILPVTLQYLDFRDTWLKPYIDILLNHCNASLKKLLIYHHDNEKNTKALVEFCKRNRTLNYVGVNKYLKLDDNIRKELETFVTLVPYECIVVDC